MTEDEARIENVVRGIHSHIPLCCIQYYVTVYLPKFMSGYNGNAADWAFVKRRLKRGKTAAQTIGRTAVNYIPCDACLEAKQFVEIHICDERCSGEPGASV